MDLGVKEGRFAGWGRHPVLPGRMVRPERYRDLAALAGVLARGLGRSYGDAALRREGTLCSMVRLDRMLGFDPGSGLLVAEAGLSLAEIAAQFLPRGWFLPVTPGTKFVTLGGAVAADVHGKNHHLDGCISAHVPWIELFTPARGLCRCGPDQDPDLFWATVGGLGLTGVIGTVALRLRPVPGPWLEVVHRPARDLDQILERLADPGSDAPYSVAWIDCLARGARLGRSVLMLGRHAEGQGEPAPPFPRAPRFALPIDLPSLCLGPLSVRVFNALYYRLNAGKTRPFRSALDPFFYPLDAIGHWNRAYGSRGFVQYQCVLPEPAAREGMRAILEAVSAAGAASFLAVLKKMGGEGRGPLSFPMAGYTLALDMPFRGQGTLELLGRLNRLVLAGGGRVNLCKDAHLDPESFRAMYPRLEAWLKVKGQVDPQGLIASSLSNRLGLTEGA
jgi:FAD/FMN-containing dehydrogenase